ncbi:hypothetical protein TWF730_004298 [Orbilia blumenaviensis]|uniref:Uncharacterized protein n=1 Tax=Orbilia blumenaviensis TaxID=1796055 RepID=A0AAV9U2A2_9PEZI
MMRRLRRQAGAAISDTAEVDFMPGKRLLLEDASTPTSLQKHCNKQRAFPIWQTGPEDESNMS